MRLGHAEGIREADLRDPAVQMAIRIEVDRQVRAMRDTNTILGAATDQVKPGEYLYMARITMTGSRFAGISFFTSETRYEPEDFAAKVAEACKIATETRIGTRREQMAKSRTPVPDAVALNEKLFPSDVDFFEAVMADKWAFKIVRDTPASGEIEPTVKSQENPT